MRIETAKSVEIYRDGGSYEAILLLHDGSELVLSLEIASTSPRSYGALRECSIHTEPKPDPIRTGSPRERELLTAVSAWLDSQPDSCDKGGPSAAARLRDMLREIERRAPTFPML